MSSIITQKLLDRLGQPDLVRVLSEKVSGTELNSLLLEILGNKTKNTSAAALLRQYQLNRFTKPADLPVVELKEAELALLKIFKHSAFEPVELSPVTVLGCCSVVGPTDQKQNTLGVAWNGSPGRWNKCYGFAHLRLKETKGMDAEDGI